MYYWKKSWILAKQKLLAWTEIKNVVKEKENLFVFRKTEGKKFPNHLTNLFWKMCEWMVISTATVFYLNISRAIENRAKCAMKNDVWLRFIIDLVAFASFIALTTQNNLSTILRMDTQFRKTFFHSLIIHYYCYTGWYF